MRKARADRRLAAAALLFGALGDPTRLALLDRLSQGGPASIAILAERFALTRQAITKHLQVLSAAGVIEGHREGRAHVWAINPARLAEAQRHLATIAAGWEGALERLKRFVERP